MIINIYGCKKKLKKSKLSFNLIFGDQTTPPNPAPEFQSYPKVCKGIPVIEVTLASDKKLTLVPNPLDRLGRPTTIQNAVYMTDNTDLVTLEPVPNTNNCVVRPTGMVGDVTIQLQCDADPGDGVIPGEALALLHIQGSVATTLEFGDPVIEDQ